MSKEVLRFVSPDGKTLWRVVASDKFYIEKQVIDAMGAVSWIPEANFLSEVASTNWIAAAILHFADQRNAKCVTVTGSASSNKQRDIDDEVPFF